MQESHPKIQDTYLKHMITELSDCTPQERQWLEQCRGANPKAQERVFKHFYGLVFGICLRYIPSRILAQEVLNDCFLKLFHHLESNNKYPTSFRPWLRQLTVHTAIDAYRKEKRHLTDRSVDGLSEEISQNEEIYSTLDAEQILALLAQLPDLWRLTFTLYEIEGYAHEEISQLLTIPISSSRVYLMRAKQRLRELLEECSTRTFIPITYLPSPNSMNNPIWNQFRDILQRYSPPGQDEAWKAFQQVQRRHQRFKYQKTTCISLLFISLFCQQTHRTSTIQLRSTTIDHSAIATVDTTNKHLYVNTIRDAIVPTGNLVNPFFIQPISKRGPILEHLNTNKMVSISHKITLPTANIDRNNSHPHSEKYLLNSVSNALLASNSSKTQPRQAQRRGKKAYTPLTRSLRNKAYQQLIPSSKSPSTTDDLSSSSKSSGIVTTDRTTMPFSQLKSRSFVFSRLTAKWPIMYYQTATKANHQVHKSIYKIDGGIFGGPQLLYNPGEKSSIGRIGGVWITLGLPHRLSIETGLSIATGFNISHYQASRNNIIFLDSIINTRESNQQTYQWWSLSLPLIVHYPLYENHRWKWSIATGLSSAAIINQRYRSIKITSLIDSTSTSQVTTNYEEISLNDPTDIILKPFRWLYMSSSIKFHALRKHELWVEPYFSYSLGRMTKESLRPIRPNLIGVQIRLRLFTNQPTGSAIQK